MTNAHFTSLDQYRDIESLNHAAAALAAGEPLEPLLAGLAAMGRDNARTPVQWDSSSHAGFTDGAPWLPATANYPTINAALQRDDEGSVFHHYRRLIALRHDEPVVSLGDFTMLLPDDEHVYAFTRHLDGATLLVVVNLSPDEQPLTLPQVSAGELVLGSLPGTPSTVPPTLRPWESSVYRVAS